MRGRYSREFKLQAVKLVIDEGLFVKEVSKQLEIDYNNLYRWIGEYEKHGEHAFPGSGSRDFIYQNQIRQLDIENEQLKDELEILKKFKAFLKRIPK
ncbi:Transposase, orfA [Alteracholeplasma palmae J233]|uniref:Transposase, orfA n=1 Tax=Alteracholeplasma palmae (strain ATCC 49389 / J233) TaxID=1318466 RepID=U4KR07_ALTPJ|nr:transposase [Alteracholeplasma palmae]CCV63761.1 Transposase, orfA [Alteracholeplasma palmae J233]